MDFFGEKCCSVVSPTVLQGGVRTTSILPSKGASVGSLGELDECSPAVEKHGRWGGGRRSVLTAERPLELWWQN